MEMKHSAVPSDEEISPELRDILKAEARTFPLRQVFVIIFMYLFTLISAFARGGKGIASIFGFATCSNEYWLFTAGFTVIASGIIALTTCMLVSQHRHYKEVNYPFESDDMLWTPHNSNTVAIVSLLTGLICGMLGLTGGVFLGPVLLMLEVKTEVANATCGFVVAFSSSVAFAQYAAAGMVNYSYGLWYASWAGVGALVGVALIESKMKASNKSSPAVFILALVLAMATVLIPIYGTMHVVSLVKSDKFSFGFREFC